MTHIPTFLPKSISTSRWSSLPELDYQPFPTREEAEDAAREWRRPSETYAIVEADETCERCKSIVKFAHAGRWMSENSHGSSRVNGMTPRILVVDDNALVRIWLLRRTRLTSNSRALFGICGKRDKG